MEIIKAGSFYFLESTTERNVTLEEQRLDLSILKKKIFFCFVRACFDPQNLSKG